MAISDVAAGKLAADSWMGYEKVNVTLKRCKAYYVRPFKALPGNPWVWRSSFPDWHVGMDTILLKRGFHVGYVDFENQYGSPQAMQEWDQFYRYLVNKVGLSPKPALEAVSRGALYALAWAKRNPDKVSCIYAETPVYDIKSWPGGKGKGIGDQSSWEQFKQVFKLNENEALAFADNPIDHLDGLASFRVPVLNVVGLQDRVTPKEENTDVFIRRYNQLGGPSAVYPITDEPQELHGHHFPINRPAEFADFIFCNSIGKTSILPYKRYYETRGGVGNFLRQSVARKHATVGFLGGSITFNPGWRNKVMAFLQERLPDTKLTFISAGIPSLGSLPHAFRLKKDLLDSGRVDLLFVEAAVNDRVNGTDKITQLKCLEGIVRHCRQSNPAMDMIMMSFADPEKITDYKKGLVPEEIKNHERVAAHYDLPSINLAKAVQEKISNNEFNWNEDFKDLHPSIFGQELYAAAIKDLLESCFEQKSSVNEGVRIAALPRQLSIHSIANGDYYPISKAHLGKDWVYVRKWSPLDRMNTRPGFVNVPVISSNRPGAELSLSFTGNAVGIAVVSGPDAGMISYAIDGAAYKRVDLFTAWSGFLHLPWYILFSSDLKPGKHLLKIRIESDKNLSSQGNACRIVHFLTNG